MKLALFGGTFDPIHKAHLIVAREAADQFGLEKVLFIPAANPPHKPGLSEATFEDRFRMVELACRVDPRFEASRLEQGEEKSYSVVTVEKVVRAGQKQVFFIIGSDAFAELATWHRWHDLVHLVEFIVVTRPGHFYQTPPGARVHRLDTLALPVSSSEVRQQLSEGRTPQDVPAAVAAYIFEHHLYPPRAMRA